MASPPVASATAFTTSPMSSGPLVGWMAGSTTRTCSRSASGLKLSRHSWCLRSCKSRVMAGRVTLQSPMTGTSHFTFLLISDLSISRCITFACRAYVSVRPVTRSLKRMPMAMSTSHSCSFTLGAKLPCMPSMPTLSGWLLGSADSPSMVRPAGMSPFSRNSTNSACAPPSSTPCPTRAKGRLALLMSSAALRTHSSSTFG